MYVYKTFYVHIYKCILGLAYDFLGLSAFLCVNIVHVFYQLLLEDIYEPTISLHSFFFLSLPLSLFHSFSLSSFLFLSLSFFLKIALII